MKQRLSVAVLCVVMVMAGRAHAALVSGLTIELLSPPELANSTALSLAHAPGTNTMVMSNGQALLTLVGIGQPLQLESLLVRDGGPIANNQATTAVAFDAQGRLYVNDHGSGVIYRRDTAADPWMPFATGPRYPKAMKFDSSGNLVVAAGPISGPIGSVLTSYDSAGQPTVLASGLSSVEDFAFEQGGGILFPDHLTGDVYRLDPLGNVAMVHDSGQEVSLTESILVTSQGRVLLGVNTGADFTVGNHNRLDRIDLTTGERITLGVDFTGLGGVGYRLPVGMTTDPVTGAMRMAVFGSIIPAQITGDLDADFGSGLAAVPEPTSAAVLLPVLALLAFRRRRR